MYTHTHTHTESHRVPNIETQVFGGSELQVFLPCVCLVGLCYELVMIPI